MRRSHFTAPAVFFTCLLAHAACGGGDAKTESDGAVGQSLSISSVTPDQGPLAGGTTITITGDNLEDMTGMVLVGDNLAANVMILDDGSISAEVPAGVNAGPADITVFSSSGYGVLGDGFSYNPLPTVSDVQPRIGTSGDTLTITGTGFAEFDPGTTTITIGDADCTAATVVNDTTATCTAGTSTAASYEPNEVVLSNDNGVASFLGFAYKGPGLLVFVGRNGSEPNQVYFIDPLAATPQFFPVGQTDRTIHSPVLLADGSYVARGFSNEEFSLFSLDIDALTTTPLSTLASGQRVTDMATNGTQLISLRQFSNDTQPFLFVLDPVQGTETAIDVTIISEVRTRMHGLVGLATNNLLVVSRGNSPAVRIVKSSAANTATASVAFTDSTPSNDNFRDLTSFSGGRIFAIRRGSSGLLPPPPGGGGGGGGTLVEIDPSAQTMTDIASFQDDLHSLVEVK